MPKIAQKTDRKQGDVVIITKDITSSSITVAAQDLSTPASGRFYIEDICCETDSTGLAGLTNFLVGTNNAKGLTGMTTGLALFETSQASLGVNKTVAIRNAGPDTSSDFFPTVTGTAGVLEAGKKLQFASTVAPGTGAGIVRVTVVLRRIDKFADVAAA